MTRLWVVLALLVGFVLGAVSVPTGMAQSIFIGVLPTNCTAGQLPVSDGANLWSCGGGGGGGVTEDVLIGETTCSFVDGVLTGCS